jgi:hypothetical protein
MHFVTQTLLAQAGPSAEAIAREIARLQHNYEFLSYGLTAAWIIMVIYVLMLVARERRLKDEITRLRTMLEEKPRETVKGSSR